MNFWSLSFAVVATCVAVAQVLPAPNVIYQVNPDPQHTQDMVPTCDPTIASATGAFLCFEYRDGQDSIQYVNPSNPRITSPTIIKGYYSSNINPPIAVTTTTAIAFDNRPTNSYYTLFDGVTGTLVATLNRTGSTAAVVYAPDLSMSFVPLGVHPKLGMYDSVMAFNISARTEQESIVWSLDFNLPPGFTGATQLGDPIYYRGTLIFMASDTFYVVNARTKTIMIKVPNPCNISTAPGSIQKLYRVSIGKDWDASTLDAFIIVANTSTTALQTTFCRVSHNNGAKKWVTSYPDDILVADVTGGDDTILVTGRILNIKNYDLQLVTWTIGATDGLHEMVINRSPVDNRCFPAVLPQPISGCQETIILQVDGNLTAYCTQDLMTPVWVSDQRCSFRPAVYAQRNTIVCVDWGNSIQHIDADGHGIWLDPHVKPMFAAQIVDNTVWALDIDVTLWGLSLDASPTPLPPPAPPHSDGQNSVSTGEVVLLVLVFIFVGALAGAVIASWIKRSRRRRAYDATVTHEDGGYGSLTGN